MSTPAGWYPDPTGRHENRWFDGNDWTDQVADGGAVAADPVQGGGSPDATKPTEAAPAATPPTAGPPPGAPGATADGLGGYVSPTAADEGGGGNKTLLIVAAVVVAVLVAGGLVFALGGGDDGGDAASDSNEEPDQSDAPEDEDPSVSDLFDDMAENADDADSGDSGDSGSDDDVFGTDDEPADDTGSDTSGGDYPPEVVDNFVNSCVGAGSSEAVCGCMIDYFQAEIPYDRFVELDRQLAENPDDIPQELLDAATACQ